MRKKQKKETLVKLREILQKVKKGWQRDEIVEFISGKYGHSESYANALYYQAFRLLEEQEPMGDLVEKTKNEALTRATSLYKDALAEKDYKTATRCLEMINKLNGLYTEKHEIKQDITTWTYEYNGENNEENQ